MTNASTPVKYPNTRIIKPTLAFVELENSELPNTYDIANKNSIRAKIKALFLIILFFIPIP